MNDKLRSILRAGLMTSDDGKRQELVRKLRELPQDEDRNRVEAALKDNSTRMDDFDSVENGQHIDKWRQHGTKLNESFMNGQEETEPIEQGSSDRDYDGIEIDVVELVNRQEFGESRFGRISASKSNAKIANALALFDHLTERDKRKISDALLDAVEEEKAKREKRPTGKQFFSAINSQLDESERLDFIEILLTKLDSPFSTKRAI